MINRTYFVKFESLQTMQEERRKLGKVTCATGFVGFRSWFPLHPGIIQDLAMKAIASEEKDFIIGEIILTAMSKV